MTASAYRLQPTYRGNRQKCQEGFGKTRCRKQAKFWYVSRSWAGGNASFYLCDLHKPNLPLTHKAGGIPVEVTP